MENQTLVRAICHTTTPGSVKAAAILVDVRNEVADLAYDMPNIINIHPGE